MNNDKNIYEDYLSEFDESISFDSETCPVCGIKVSDTILVSNSPYIDLLKADSESTADLVYKKFENNNLDYKVYKEIDTTCLDSIKYQFRIVVAMKDIYQANKLLEELANENIK
ncbi:MAG TPA: hypothetical protein VK870_10740 [Ignavibacteriaceae bacterium]|nr:hypothetical protein [Ignavibacteriaceae bacterium]